MNALSRAFVQVGGKPVPLLRPSAVVLVGVSSPASLEMVGSPQANLYSVVGTDGDTKGPNQDTGISH